MGVNDAGRLDRRINLLAFVTTQATTGEAVRSWVTLAQVWGSRHPGGSRRVFAADAKHSEQIITYRIRHRDDVQSFQRLSDGDDIFEIFGTSEVGRKHFLDVECRAIDQSTGAQTSTLPEFQTDANGNVLTDENDVALRKN